MLQLYRKGSKIPIIGTNLKKNAFKARKKLLKHVDVFVHKNIISLKYYLNKPLMKLTFN